MRCSNGEEFNEFFIADNITFYTSEPLQRDEVRGIRYYGIGNAHLNNIRSSISDKNMEYVVFVYLDNNCLYHPDRIPQFTLNNSYFGANLIQSDNIRNSLPPVRILSSRRGVNGPFEARFLNTKFENLKIERGGVLSCDLNEQNDLFIQNITIQNIKIFEGYLFNVLNSQNATVQDVYISHFETTESALVTFTSENIVMTNISMQNLIGTTILERVFEIEYRSTLEVNQFRMKDSPIQFKNSFFSILESSASGAIAFTDLSFENYHTLDSSMFLDMSRVKDLKLDGLSFINISTPEEDYLRVLINLHVETNSENTTMSIENVFMQNSTKPLLYFTNQYLEGEGNHEINFNNITIKDCHYSDTYSLIEISNKVHSHSLAISMTQLAFNNISFPVQGYLLSLNHQLFPKVALSDVTISNTWNSGIMVHSTEDQSNQVTSASVYNLTATDVFNTMGSFLYLEKRAQASIFHSSFTNLKTDENGAVISVTGSSKATFHNSIFMNNTARRGGVFIAEDQGGVIMHACTISNNFAIDSGVGIVRNNGYFELYQCNIINNYGMYVSIFDIFSSSLACIFDNTIITQNIIINVDEIEEFLENHPISERIRSIIETYREDLKGIKDHFALRVTQGILTIRNNSWIVNQEDSTYVVYSTVTFKDSFVADTAIHEPVLLAKESEVILSNLAFANVTSVYFLSVISIFESVLTVQNLIFDKIDIPHLEIVYSQGNIKGITAEYMGKDHMLIFTGCTLDSLDNIEIKDSYQTENINGGTTEVVAIQRSSIHQMSNHSYLGVAAPIFSIKYSIIDTIMNISIMNSYQAFFIFESDLYSVQNLTIMDCGDKDSIYSGGVHLKNSNASISGSLFGNNSAQAGGAIHVHCDPTVACTTSISNSRFLHNIARDKGGAIFYSLQRPIMTNSVFVGNIAPYGPDYASYAVKIVLAGSTRNHVLLTDVGSGIQFDKSIQLSVVDNDGQVMDQENDSSLKILPTANNSISGLNSVKLINGTATFSDLTFKASPGRANVVYKVSSPLLHKTQILYGVGVDAYNETEYQNLLYVSFRFCRPGEIIQGDVCRICSYGTFSLDWNSTSCSNCLDKSECLGGTQISLDSGYWRKDTNSTTFIKCLNDKACIGGFHPDNEYPVECITGYKGPLCAYCDIVNGTKFQHLSYTECMKCPDLYLNTIRVVGLGGIAVFFLSCLIIVNIRKKNENQVSIMLRIFTNYLQLTSLSLSLGTGIPSSFSDTLDNANHVSSPDSAFMSFDCFIEDYQIKAFAPSNMMFKEFLTLLLPLALIICTFIILVIYKLMLWIVRLKTKTHLKRYTVVSIICIIFLLHPNLTLSSLSMFQCIKVDEDDYRMKNHMDYQCYSGKHLGWAFAIGLPNLIVWVITLPIFGLVSLVRNRKNLNKYRMRKYLLILYQGFKPEAFYWEFVNKTRNFSILMCIIVFSQASMSYKVLLCCSIILIFLRIQIRVRPYKLDQNNKIEILSVISSTFTFSCLIVPNFGSELPALRIFLLVIVLIANLRFLVLWSYLFMCSWNLKNPKFNSFLSLYAFLICQKKMEDHAQLADMEDRVKIETRDGRSQKKTSPKKKLKVKKVDESSYSRDKFNDQSVDIAANISIDMPLCKNRYIRHQLFENLSNRNRSDLSSPRQFEETKIKIFHDELSKLSLLGNR